MIRRARDFGIEDWEESLHWTVLRRVRSRFGVLECFPAKNMTRKRSDDSSGMVAMCFPILREKISTKYSTRGANVFGSLAQGRQRYWKYVQAIVQIASKLVTLDHSFEIAVSCRDEPHVDSMGVGTSETFEFLFLQHTQKLGL